MRKTLVMFLFAGLVVLTSCKANTPTPAPTGVNPTQITAPVETLAGSPYPPPTAELPIQPTFPYPAPFVDLSGTITPIPSPLPTQAAPANITQTIQPVIYDLEHPIPGGGLSVSFIDELHGWLAASPGPGNFRDPRVGHTALFVTRDGGQQWNWLADASVGDLDFVSAQRGWGRGGQGLLTTTDGGSTWEEFPLPGEWFGQDWHLHTSDFSSPQRGWVVLAQDASKPLYVGQHSQYNIFRTTDGGSTWESASLPCAQRYAGATAYWERITVHLAGEQDAWLVCGGNPVQGAPLGNWRELYGWLWHSQDDGRTWKASIQVSLWALYNQRPHGIAGSGQPSIAFADEQLGWVGTGDFGLIRTSDGGYTWHDTAMHFEDPPFRDVHVFSSLHGLVVWSNSFSGKLAETRDGGQTWQVLFPPALPRLFQFSDPQNGVGQGTFPLQSNLIFRTQDGGRTWQPTGQEVDPTHPMQGNRPKGRVYSPTNPLEAALVDRERLYWSGDGERTWKAIQFDDRIFELDLLPDGAIWLLGLEHTTHGRGDGIYLWFSPDQGTSWRQINFGEDDPRSHPSFDFVDAQHGWLRTSDHLYATQDGGFTWKMLQ
ncbi:MAG: hypothetical protein AB1894_03845 [Chloroflexota bacterium]